MKLLRREALRSAVIEAARNGRDPEPLFAKARHAAERRDLSALYDSRLPEPSHAIVDPTACACGDGHCDGCYREAR